MTSRPARLARLFTLTAVVATTGYLLARPYMASAALIARAANLRGPAVEWIGDWQARTVSTSDVRIPARSGALAARVYRPEGRPRRGVLLNAGVNPRGLDEPRLASFARTIAERGLLVVTPVFPDLADFRITPRLTDQIEDAAAWLASQKGLAPDGQVGLVGISFSGGLSVVASGRPALRDRVAYVVSLGGHGDLPRTLKYLGSGVLPDGRRHPAHDYGVVVVLHNVAEGLVPPEQVDLLRRGTRTFLLASTVYMSDPRRGAAMAEDARTYESTLPEPARTLMRYVNQRDTTSLAPMLAGKVPGLTSDPALSPERSPAPRAPVYLLHGQDDNVIPASESVLLARWLAERQTRTRHLITPLISHADVDRTPTARDAWRLIRFWADVVPR